MMKFNVEKIKIYIPVIIFLLFTLYQINDSYFIDELFSIKNAETLDKLFVDVHPPLYTFILKIWIFIFGNSEILTRILSVIAGGIAVFLLSKINFNAGILLSISQIVHDVSVTTRSYSFLLLFGSLSLYLLHKKRNYLFVSTTLMSLTHYYGIFTSIGLHIYDIYSRKSIGAVKGFGIYVIVVLSWLLFHVSRMDMTRGGWINDYKLIEFLSGALGSTWDWIAILWFFLLFRIPLMEGVVVTFSLISPMVLSFIRPQLLAHYAIAVVPFTMLLIAKKFKGKYFILILFVFILSLFFGGYTFMEQDYRAASIEINNYENPMIISLEVDQSYYFNESKVCEHVKCVEWAILEKHDSIWLINGAFANISYYSLPLIHEYDEEILYFKDLEVGKYTKKR
jgi:hypothetical protein